MLALLPVLALPPERAAAAEAEPAEPSTVQGVVVEVAGGAAVEGAMVQLMGTAHQALTDASGAFALTGVVEGDYVLEVVKIGYFSRTQEVSVEEGHDLWIEVELAVDAIALDPITVVSRPSKLVSVGFYERQVAGHGTFFTREEIEKKKIRRMTSLLSRAAGIRHYVDRTGKGQVGVRGRSTFVTNCSIDYFIDGVRAELGLAGGPDIVPIGDVQAVEVYRGPAEIPSQFNIGRSMCGAVLIWTRGGGRH